MPNDSKFEIPNPGEIWAFVPDPKKGHEQKGYRPHLVISTAFKNDRTGIVTCVPLTTANHSFPTHIPIPTGLSAEGFIETEQINSYDFYARHAVRKGELPSEFFRYIMEVINASLGLDN